MNAVVGVTALANPDGTLKSMGIQCALCHSTVDDSFAPGIGHRLDGWANRDLNVGAIVALAPDLSVLTTLLEVDDATVRTVLSSWGPGKFGAELLLDGKAFRADGKSSAVLIPPAFGLAGGNLDRIRVHHLLERIRRQPGDAREGHFLRSQAERSQEVQGGRQGRLRKRA